MSKVCSKCGEKRSVSEFFIHGGTKKPMAHCKKCHSSYKNSKKCWFKSSRYNHVEDTRAQRLWSKHRMTIEMYHDLLESQGGACAICKGISTSNKSFAIDHDHSCCPSGRSCHRCRRGLLCESCNRGIGLLQDDAGLLMNAADHVISSRDLLGEMLDANRFTIPDWDTG